MTEALGRLVTTLDVIGLEAFVPEPPRGAGRPPPSPDPGLSQISQVSQTLKTRSVAAGCFWLLLAASPIGSRQRLASVNH